MNEIYFLRPVGQEGPVKIGHSIAPCFRLRVYQAWSPIPLEVAAKLPAPGDDGPRKRRFAMHLEKRFHLKYAASRLHHEWFAASAELTADIEAIRAGTFDVNCLPVWISVVERMARERAEGIAA